MNFFTSGKASSVYNGGTLTKKIAGENQEGGIIRGKLLENRHGPPWHRELQRRHVFTSLIYGQSYPPVDNHIPYLVPFVPNVAFVMPRTLDYNRRQFHKSSCTVPLLINPNWESGSPESIL